MIYKSINYAYMIRQCLLVQFVSMCGIWKLVPIFFFSSMRVFASKLSESGCIYTLKEKKKRRRLNGIYAHRVLRKRNKSGNFRHRANKSISMTT